MPHFFGLFPRNKRSRAAQFGYDSKLDYCEEPSEISSNLCVTKDLPPPPYSSSDPSPSTGPHKKHVKPLDFRKPLSQESLDEALIALRAYDIVILVDDSGSMRRHWEEAGAALADIAEVASKYDQDGIDIHFLNTTDLTQELHTNLTKPSQVLSLFKCVSPSGPTPLGDRLDELLREYLDKIERAKASSSEELKKIKRINFIVITDGVPTDDPKEAIVDASRRLHKGKFPLAQVGIQLVQIGQSTRAAKFLKNLDDDLAKEDGVRDIVDTTPYFGHKLTRDVLIKIMLGGINRKFDAEVNHTA
ncbi:hypothetical protein GYMLUDRAFT_49429 [Collybiopsis luxurians FD-317 M1]|uniref:Unplaced genomic scaffold GYMLUscaffold_83, whole genome shotgun sequence n=1 Tax=Collybiopsis luxurians FD-317 M1 TaxID=944289 RepID=A0A0D0BUK0_9AGAR|nr:hypothetical protein GYMLUDRAFT_49429 [Collybiopsis luxurians FD-317 M1]